MSGPLVDEVDVQLTLNGQAAFSWRCTPADLEALAIGRLYLAGLISAPDAAHLIIDRVGADALQIAARVEVSASITRQPPTRSLTLPTAECFADLFRSLFAAVEARHESGGMHAAAASDGQRIIKQVEDVGRHNTIDKIVGALLLDGISPQGMGLLTSSRISGEIADKVTRAGFAWLASRSIPTTLAVRIAQQAHMPIVGRAASRNASVY